MKLRAVLFMFLAVFVMAGSRAVSQEEDNDSRNIDVIKGRVDAMDENVTTLLGDVAGLKKLKVSGYLQFQYEKTEAGKGLSMNPYDSSNNVQGRFRVRRSRLKFAYNSGLTEMVVQGDFSNEKFELKDAYMKITDPWTKYFSLTAGVFNRPNYEVEYSSSQRESPERSLVIRTLYPGERDLGAMLTVAPDDLFKLQLAGFNNTFQGDLKQYYPNFRNEPFYFMARLTKELEFRELGMGIDLGAHARIGNIVSNASKVIKSDQNTSDANLDSNQYGKTFGRNWFGLEAQMYFDWLGGMKILGEYITGKDVDQLSTADKKPAPAIRQRDFSGYYVMLVKNLPCDFQAAAKYDVYNPNTTISEDHINTKSELKTSTLGLGIHNYTFSNVRISLWYDMITTATSKNLVKGKELLPDDPIDNLLTLRLQYKF